MEAAHAVELPGGPVPYTLRRMARARRLRVTIDPRRGVLVTVPPPTRRGWAQPVPVVEEFLRARETWLRRHLERQSRERAELAARGSLGDGSLLRYRGELHRVRLLDAPDAARSSVARVGGDDGDELVVRLAAVDRRSLAEVLEAWLRERARGAVEREVARHAAALGVAPVAISIRDQRTRWGSASRAGRLSFSWRLVLAPPAALETVVVHELCHGRIFGHGPRFWELVASRVPEHAIWRRWLRHHALELHAALEEPAVGVGADEGAGEGAIA